MADRKRSAPRDKRKDLTGTIISNVLDYDPETGLFTSKVSSSPRRQKGSIVGGLSDQGYVLISVNKCLVRAHRLAWVWMTGRWPVGDIDHINGNRSDNRFCNLREATRSQNLQNSGLRCDNKTGVTGVIFDRARKKYKAYIRVGGKQKIIGRYSSMKDAVAARRREQEKHFGDFSPDPRAAFKG